jgi:hypothetical protein
MVADELQFGNRRYFGGADWPLSGTELDALNFRSWPIVARDDCTPGIEPLLTVTIGGFTARKFGDHTSQEPSDDQFVNEHDGYQIIPFA